MQHGNATDPYRIFFPLGIVLGAMGVAPDARAPLQLANTGHPAADAVTLAHATRSHVHALGLDWDDASGRNNGQYAPFSWQGG